MPEAQTPVTPPHPAPYLPVEYNTGSGYPGGGKGGIAVTRVDVPVSPGRDISIWAHQSPPVGYGLPGVPVLYSGSKALPPCTPQEAHTLHPYPEKNRSTRRNTILFTV